MIRTPFGSLLFSVFLFPVMSNAQPDNDCTQGSTIHSLDGFHISFCLPDYYKETFKNDQSIALVTEDKKDTVSFNVFTIVNDTVSSYFISARDKLIKSLNGKAGWNLVVDNTEDNGESFENVPDGFEKYNLVYKLKETKSGKFYFIIYDYLLKTKEDDPDFKHGISLFQFVKDNESDMWRL